MEHWLIVGQYEPQNGSKVWTCWIFLNIVFDFYICLKGLGTLVKDLDQETAKRPFRSSSQAATCYYQSNHSKAEEISLSALPKDTISELPAYLHTDPFNCWT